MHGLMFDDDLVEDGFSTPAVKLMAECFSIPKSDMQGPICCNLSPLHSDVWSPYRLGCFFAIRFHKSQTRHIIWVPQLHIYVSINLLNSI